MIDNYSKAMDLIEKMKEHLPFPASPTKQLIQSLNEKGIKITKDMEFEKEISQYQKKRIKKLIQRQG